MAEPPRQQVVKGRSLAWEEFVPKGKSKSHQVLSCVKQVRNNLFHGGKRFAAGTEIVRNGKLIAASLNILRACIDRQAEVRVAFGL